MSAAATSSPEIEVVTVDLMTSYRHVALLIGDLRSAEEYYEGLFDMDVVVREGKLEDGRWASLPENAGWDEAVAAGVELGMVGLQRDQFTLALFAVEPSGVQAYAIGLLMAEDEIGQVCSRLPEDTAIEASSDGYLAFVDRFGVRWQLGTTRRFVGAGVREGLWLEI